MDPTGSENPFKGDSSANPFSQGEPMPSGEPGMAPVGDGTDPMGTTTIPETTKPRQMPAGAPPMPGPLGPTGDPAATGTLPGADPQVNTPQPAPPTQSVAIKVRAVRRDILESNPDMLPAEAHHLAMQVVAFQHLAASPMGPAPRPGSVRPPAQNQQQGRGNFGDLNDPRNPYSPLHPNHPMYQGYGGARTPFNQGRGYVQNPWADYARSNGYAGNSPTLVGGAEKAMGWAADKVSDWWNGRGQHPTQADDPGTEPNGAGSRDFNAPAAPAHPTGVPVVRVQRNVQQPPAVKPRVIPQQSADHDPATTPQVQQGVHPDGGSTAPKPKKPSKAASLVYLQAGER